MNVLGFDDGPFPRSHRGDVPLVGALCADTRLDAVLAGKVRRDGRNATRAMVELARRSGLADGLGAVMLQGIAVAGFNVVDIAELSRAVDAPVLVVARKRPNLRSIRAALFGDGPRPRVAGAARKWALIEQAGPMELLEIPPRGSGLKGQPQRLWIQRARLSTAEARRLVVATTLHGQLPEPIRLAHLIAGGLTTGRSRGRA
jgi:endonuclease V-like protein UPF0215 family